MVPSETKCIAMIPAVTAAAAASTTVGGIDTLGFDYCTIDLVIGSIASNTDVMTYLQVCESNTVKPTAYTDGDVIVALTGGTHTSATAGFVLPAASTCTVVPVGSNYRMNIDLRGRKRYLGLLVTPGITANLSAVAMLSRAHVDPAMPVVAVATNSTAAYQCRLNVSA